MGRDRRVIGQLLGAAAVPALLLGARPRTAGGVVFAYHDIGPDGSDATSYLLPARMLRRHLEAVRGWGLRLVDLGELTGAVREGRPLDGMVAVTFDDACQGVTRYAIPVLHELGVPATVFAVSGVRGATPTWAPPGTRTMTTQELAEAARSGLRIGSHTRSHPDLLSLDEGALDAELAGSRADLEEVVDGRVDHLTYPFGHHDERVRAAARRAGYDAAFTFLDGRVEATLDRYRLPRLTMYGGHHRVRLAYQLARPASSWPDHQLDRVAAAT
ncbi:MAG: polysaccharide deacetylase family protein [Acidimicrobiia bacterium]